MSEKVKEIRTRTHIAVESCRFEWSIENFSFCGLQGLEHLVSPKFSTGRSSLTTWNLNLYPNKNKSAEEEGAIGLFLRRNSTDSSTHYTTFKN